MGLIRWSTAEHGDNQSNISNCITLLRNRHIFAIGSAAYERLTSRDGEPQVVIISGESGSGKTEATKLIMQYLAAVNKATPPSSSLVTEQILEASPLLESFGNATTVRNDNSSRFGKYTQIFFRKLVLHYLFIQNDQCTRFCFNKSKNKYGRKRTELEL